MISRSWLSLLCMLLLLLLLLLSIAPPAACQRRLSEQEMRGVINLLEYNNVSEQRHECSYMAKAADGYSAVARSSPGGSAGDRFYLECCAGRKFPVCGGSSASIQRRCCPGFARFVDLDGVSKCNQRVLADREAVAWLNDLRPDADGFDVSGFVRAFVNTRQVDSVLQPRLPNNATWTILAVAEAAFRPGDVTGFRSAGNCSDSEAITVAPATIGGEGRSGGGRASAGKVIEGSASHKELIYQQKCQELEAASNATGAVDFGNEAWKHLIRGRKYISDLRKEATVLSMYKTDSGQQYPLKFSRYSSGVACIECAPIVEANLEASNAVIHILGKSILTKSKAASLGELLQARFPDFWALVAEPERRLLKGGGGCGAFHTVFVPRSTDALAGLSDDERPAAIRHHLVKGLWCTAGLLDSETQPVATESAESVRFVCDASSRRLVGFGRSFQSQAVLSEAAGEFDIMATNGVVHVVDRPILPSSATSLMSALQADAAELLQEQSAAESLVVGLIRDCSVKLRNDTGYIVLLPTDEAFQNFFTHRAIPEAANFHDRLDVRCSLLRHHILEAGRGLTSLGRATHLQRTYRTLNGDLMADFLFVKNGVLKAYFMNTEVVHGADGHEFLNGHIYHTKEVLVPPNSPVWTRMVDQIYGEQKRVISRFRSLVSRSAGGDRLMTLFLPRTGYASLINLGTLQGHIADTVFYLNYLTGEAESIDLTALSGGSISITREAGQYFVSAAGSMKKVPLNDCGVKLSVGIICSIEEPL